MDWIVWLLLVGLIYGVWKARKNAALKRQNDDEPLGVFRWDEPLDVYGWDEPDSLAPSDPKPIAATLRLTYTDVSGRTSERQVDVKECDTINSSGYLIAYCHLRKAIRTFRIDRVKRAVDMETGEVITDLLSFASRKYEESPVASLDRLFNDASDALRALFYIGKADGRFTAKEKLVFLGYCHAASGDDRITMKQVDNACNNMPVPSKQAFKLVCGRLSQRDEAQRMTILDATEKRIATEKTISGEEADALAYMRKRLATARRLVAQ